MKFLFQPGKFSLQSPTFRIDEGKQITIVAVGMQPEDYITFEAINLKAGAPPIACGCVITAAEMPSVEGIQELKCPACLSETLRPVRLTDRNPIVILDSPQDVLLRAVYHGDGVDVQSVTVWYDETATPNLTDTMRGCPPVCCEDEEQTWIPNGIHRCVDGNVELQEVSNCGNLRWVICGIVVWTPTGLERCDEVSHYIEEINQCGHKRWVVKEPINWLQTGVQRCTDTVVQYQEVNQCNDLRWVDGEDIVWVDTGLQRCVPGSETDTEIEQRNQCGDTRWVTGPDQEWIATCCTRCTATDHEVQEVNQCGLLRWVVDAPLAWVDTGDRRCSGANYEREERNQCGITRWVVEEAIEWVGTGNYRCEGGNYQRQEVNQCNRLRWTVIEPTAWVWNGLSQCIDNNRFNQEMNQCGQVRWTDSGEVCDVVTIGENCGLVGDGTLVDPLCIDITQVLVPGPCITMETTPEGQTVINTADCDVAFLYEVVSVTPLDSTIDAGANACYEIVITPPVDAGDAPLGITTLLSGTDQDAHGYTPPTGAIPAGGTSLVLCVPTINDGGTNPDRSLCLAVNAAANLDPNGQQGCVTVQDSGTEPTIYEVVSVTAVEGLIDAGDNACYDIVINPAVDSADAPLTITGVLSGTEQAAHGYPAPSGNIGSGGTTVQLCVTTIDTENGLLQDLCLAVQGTSNIDPNGQSDCVDVQESSVESVSFSNQSLIAQQALPGATTVTCRYQVRAAGTVYKNGPPVTTLLETWLLGGLNSDYEVRMSYVSGTAFAGSALNTWLLANADRQWTMTRSGTEGENNGTGLIECRRVSDGVVLDSATVTLRAILVDTGP